MSGPIVLLFRLNLPLREDFELTLEVSQDELPTPHAPVEMLVVHAQSNRTVVVGTDELPLATETLKLSFHDGLPRGVKYGDDTSTECLASISWHWSMTCRVSKEV